MRKGKFSKLIIAAVIVLNILFCVAVLYVFLKTSCEPSALIASWFGFTTVELWNLKEIKKKKIKESEKNNNDGFN